MSEIVRPRARPVGDVRGRHRSVRRGRERGCWVYVPGEQLRLAGVDINAAPPDYRLWPGQKRTMMVQFYAREPDMVAVLIERTRELGGSR